MLPASVTCYPIHFLNSCYSMLTFWLVLFDICCEILVTWYKVPIFSPDTWFLKLLAQHYKLIPCIDKKIMATRQLWPLFVLTLVHETCHTSLSNIHNLLHARFYILNGMWGLPVHVPVNKSLFTGTLRSQKAPSPNTKDGTIFSNRLY